MIVGCLILWEWRVENARFAELGRKLSTYRKRLDIERNLVSDEDVASSRLVSILTANVSGGIRHAAALRAQYMRNRKTLMSSFFPKLISPQRYPGLNFGASKFSGSAHATTGTPQCRTACSRRGAGHRPSPQGRPSPAAARARASPQSLASRASSRCCLGSRRPRCRG